jgi:hypothetical protein
MAPKTPKLHASDRLVEKVTRCRGAKASSNGNYGTFPSKQLGPSRRNLHRLKSLQSLHPPNTQLTDN